MTSHRTNGRNFARRRVKEWEIYGAFVKYAFFSASTSLSITRLIGRELPFAEIIDRTFRSFAEDFGRTLRRLIWRLFTILRSGLRAPLARTIDFPRRCDADGISRCPRERGNEFKLQIRGDDNGINVIRSKARLISEVGERRRDVQPDCSAANSFAIS